MRHKKYVRLHPLSHSTSRSGGDEFPLFQRMVVPFLVLLCVVVVAS